MHGCIHCVSFFIFHFSFGVREPRSLFLTDAPWGMAGVGGADSTLDFGRCVAYLYIQLAVWLIYHGSCSFFLCRGADIVRVAISVFMVPWFSAT